ncbi:hypothetical protein ACTFIR_003662 [Dictyostelium discoideum]
MENERIVVDLKIEIQELESKIRFLKQKQHEQEIQLKNGTIDDVNDDQSYIGKNNSDDDDDDDDDENESNKELKELINDYSIYNNTKYSKDFMKGDKKSSSKNNHQSLNELNQTNNIIENLTGYKISKTNSNIVKDDDDFRYGDFEYGGYCNQIKFNINFTVGRKKINLEKEKKKEKEKEKDNEEDDDDDEDEDEDEEEEEEEEEEDDEDKENRVDKRIAQQPFIQQLSINVEIPSLVLSSSHFGQFIEYCKRTKSLSDFLKIFQRISSFFKRRNSFFKLLINKINNKNNNNNNNNNSIISYKESQIDDDNYFSSVIIYHEPSIEKPKITIIWEIEYNQMKQSLLEDFRVIGDSTIYSEDTMKEIKEKLNLLSIFDQYPISSLPLLLNLITNPNSQQKKNKQKQREEQQQEEEQQEEEEEQQQEEQQEEQQQEEEQQQQEEEEQQQEQQKEEEQQEQQEEEEQQEEKVQIQEKKRKRIKRY